MGRRSAEVEGEREGKERGGLKRHLTKIQVAPFIHRTRYICLVLFLALVGLSAWQVTYMRPSTSPPDFFPASSNIQWFMDWQQYDKPCMPPSFPYSVLRPTLPSPPFLPLSISLTPPSSALYNADSRYAATGYASYDYSVVYGCDGELNSGKVYPPPPRSVYFIFVILLYFLFFLFFYVLFVILIYFDFLKRMTNVECVMGIMHAWDAIR